MTDEQLKIELTAISLLLEDIVDSLKKFTELAIKIDARVTKLELRNPQ
jgi:hypothetical protein